MVCYVDDTLILASANEIVTAVCRANLQVGLVLNRLRRMDLKVAAEKTEVVAFQSRKRLPQAKMPRIQVGEMAVEISTKMKYLGVILDSRLSFKDHFNMMEGKAAKISRALCRIMPNLRGPSEFKRKLYMETVKSIILYGVPIWSEELQRSREAMRGLDRVMRTLTLRAISAYRTVSLDAASLLARIPPLHLMARERQRVFVRLRDLKDTQEWSEMPLRIYGEKKHFY